MSLSEQFRTLQLARVEEGNVRRQNSGPAVSASGRVSRNSWSVIGPMNSQVPSLRYPLRCSKSSLAASHHQHARTVCLRTERGIFVKGPVRSNLQPV